MIDIQKVRTDTPNCEGKLFFNSAGASLMPKIVVEKTIEYLKAEEKIGGYKVEALQEKSIHDFYVEAAQLIDAEAHNIAFMKSATDGYMRVLSCFDFKAGDLIITSQDDYSSNHIHFISMKNRLGIKVLCIETLENGDLSIPHFEQLLHETNPRLVAISHIPTNSGLVQNVEAIGALCQQHEVPFLLDACQSIGQIEVNVKQIQCDFLTTAGRKFLRGPRGSGFLFVSDKMLKQAYAPLLLDGKGATWKDVDEIEIQEGARRFETWENSYACLMGCKAAIQYARAIGLNNIEAANKKNIEQLRANLAAIPSVSQYDKGSRKCNILTFRKANKNLEETKAFLDKNLVLYSVSSSEWGLLDFRKKEVDWVIRLSPHYFNTLEEINQISNLIESF